MSIDKVDYEKMLLERGTAPLTLQVAVAIDGCRREREPERERERERENCLQIVAEWRNEKVAGYRNGMERLGRGRN